MLDCTGVATFLVGLILPAVFQCVYFWIENKPSFLGYLEMRTLTPIMKYTAISFFWMKVGGKKVKKTLIGLDHLMVI